MQGLYPICKPRKNKENRRMKGIRIYNAWALIKTLSVPCRSMNKTVCCVQWSRGCVSYYSGPRWGSASVDVTSSISRFSRQVLHEDFFSLIDGAIIAWGRCWGHYCSIACRATGHLVSTGRNRNEIIAARGLARITEVLVHNFSHCQVQFFK